jgi:protein-S-isoprenylcysteine O-methyltransferase Ste14
MGLVPCSCAISSSALRCQLRVLMSRDLSYIRLSGSGRLPQALLLPNWVAGFAAMIGHSVLFFGRLPHEEQLMLKSFGDDYCKYMEQTYRLVPGIY